MKHKTNHHGWEQTNEFFNHDIIRKLSKYCSICGKKLDLDGFWHLPFCTNCRFKIIDEALDTTKQLMKIKGKRKK